MRSLPLSGQVIRVVSISPIAVPLEASSQQHGVLCCCHAFTKEVEGKGPVVGLEGLLQVVQVLQIGVQPVLKPAGFRVRLNLVCCFVMINNILWECEFSWC